MGYLAENLVYFMAEAVDRNGKKDPSLGMKHAKDFDKKYKGIEHKAFEDNYNAEQRHEHIYQSGIADNGGLDASHRMIHHKNKYGTDSRMDRMDSDGHSGKYNCHTNFPKYYARHNGSEETDHLTHAKLMTRDAKAKKAHNESALFNDPIWDEL